MDNSGRAGSWQGHSDNVHIREVGAPTGREPAYPGEAFPPEAATQNNISRPQRRNSPFLAAWILTGILIAVGFLWMGGALEDGSTATYGYTVSMDPATGLPVEPESRPLEAQLRNLGFIAPFMLLIGLASAAALLALQGVRKSQMLPAPSSGQEVQQR